MLLEVHLHAIVYVEVPDTIGPQQAETIRSEVCQSVQASIMDAVTCGSVDPEEDGEVIYALARPEIPHPLYTN